MAGSSNKAQVKLYMIDILSKTPTMENKEIAKQIKLDYFVRCDYRTIAKYRTEIEQTLLRIRAQMEKEINKQIPDLTEKKSIISSITKIFKGT